MISAIVFLVSVILAIFFVIRSEFSLAWRLGLAAAVVIFAVSAYLLATNSAVSPFAASQTLSFGYWDNSVPLTVGTVGAVFGVVGSYLIKQDRAGFDWRGLIKPLLISPMLIIPTVKLVEAAEEQTFMTMLLVFAMSYQNGFFWERVMKGEKS
jgi:hypothetical protein